MGVTEERDVRFPTLYGKKCLGTVSCIAGLPANLTQFTWSLANLMQFGQEYICQPGEFIHLDPVAVSYHAKARNAAVDRFLGDWIFFLDTDHVFDPDLLSRLLTLQYAYDLEVVSGNYFQRVPPFYPVTCRFEENSERLIMDLDKETGKLRWGPQDSLYELENGGTGGGCLLIQRSVFPKLRKLGMGEPFENLPPWYEDYSFFWRCHEAGVKCWLAPRVECHHLQVRPVSQKDHVEAMKKWGVENE